MEEVKTIKMEAKINPEDVQTTFDEEFVNVSKDLELVQEDVKDE